MRVKHVAITSLGPTFRARDAMLTPVKRADSFKRKADGDRQSVIDYWQHGESVNEVSHYGRHTTVQGDVLAVESMIGEVMAYVQVLDIVMVNGADLTDDDAQALGYMTLDEYLDEHPLGEEGWRAWMMRVKRLTAQQVQNGKVH